MIAWLPAPEVGWFFANTDEDILMQDANHRSHRSSVFGVRAQLRAALSGFAEQRLAGSWGNRPQGGADRARQLVEAES